MHTKRTKIATEYCHNKTIFCSLSQKKVRTEHTNSSNGSCMKMHNIANSFHVFCKMKSRNNLKYFLQSVMPTYFVIQSITIFALFFQIIKVGLIVLISAIGPNYGFKTGYVFLIGFIATSLASGVCSLIDRSPPSILPTPFDQSKEKKNL